MRKKKITHPSQQRVSPSANWIRSSFYVLSNGKRIDKDDIIRIDGQKGLRFMFLEHVVNPDNEKEWITVHEIHKGALGMYRSFRPESIRSMSPRKKPRVYRKKS